MAAPECSGRPKAFANIAEVSLNAVYLAQSVLTVRQKKITNIFEFSKQL